MPIERPMAGGDVALEDDDLARLGLTVVYEAAAKAVAASALRALRALDDRAWIRLERTQFKQILAAIEPRVLEIADEELSSRFRELQEALANAHEVRHVIVHVMWGAGGEGALGYDYGRQREVTPADIRAAVEGGAELRRAASWFAVRVANLVEEGVLVERDAGRGMTLRTERGPVRL